MPKIYTAKYMRNGSVVKRDIFLPDERSVRAAIVMEGGIPLSISEKSVAWWRRAWIDKEEKIRFLSAVAMNSATYSPGKALLMTIEHEADTRRRLEFEPALEVLNRGGSFSEAVEELRMFDRAVLAIFKTGEETGTLTEAIRSAIEYLDNRKKIWKDFSFAAIWLVFDIMTAISSVLGVQFFFLPWIQSSGIGSQIKNPQEAARFFNSIDSAYFINELLLLVTALGLVVAATVIVGLFVKKGMVRDALEKMTARVPVVRAVVFDGGVADSFYVVGKMLSGSVSFLTALSTAEGASVIPAVKNIWSRARQALYEGTSIHRAFDSALITSSEKSLLAAHQNNKQLAQVFMSIAEARYFSYHRGMRRAVVLITLLTIVYVMAVALNFLQVVMLQSDGLSGFLNNMGGGM